MNGKNRVDGCATKDMAAAGGYPLDSMVGSQDDYEDLRWMVVEGAQRNGFDIQICSAEINSTRTVAVVFNTE